MADFLLVQSNTPKMQSECQIIALL